MLVNALSKKLKESLSQKALQEEKKTTSNRSHENKSAKDGASMAQTVSETLDHYQFLKKMRN